VKSSFREQLEKDIRSVFLNPCEFGEMHQIEGREDLCGLTDDVYKEGDASLGVIDAELIIYATPSDLPPRKSPGASLNVDGREYIIIDWSVDAAIAKITLQQTRVT